MSNVIDLPVITTLDIPPDKVLEAAKGGLSEVVVIGWDDDGNLYLAGSTANVTKVNWLIDHAKQSILSVDQDF